MHPSRLTYNHNFHGGWLLALLCLLLGSVACTSDTPEAEGPQLLGRWEIEKALRNGRAAESLSTLFFQFDENNDFTTNISGEEERGQFSEADGVITTTDLSMPLEYTVADLGDSSLLLKATVARYRFEFFLRRVADQTAVPADGHSSK